MLLSAQLYDREVANMSNKKRRVALCTHCTRSVAYEKNPSGEIVVEAHMSPSGKPCPDPRRFVYFCGREGREVV